MPYSLFLENMALKKYYLKYKYLKLFLINLFSIILYNLKFIKKTKIIIDKINYCDTEHDPIYAFRKRLNSTPFILCKSNLTEHICYQNDLSYFWEKNGVLCLMKNFTIDPSFWKEDGYTYNGPVNSRTRGSPLISNGFFNMKCFLGNNFYSYNKIYDTYFKSWKYTFINNNSIYKEVEEEELSPGKIVFFISRNQDSPNMFHGGSEFINAFSLMYLLNLKPENIQIVFLESMKFNDDPFYYLYKNIISRGGEPLHIRSLNKRYHISNAIHLPINWDSPCFTKSDIPNCKNKSKTYHYLYNSVLKYMNITKFVDNKNYNKEIFYYPKSFINSELSNYNKFLTIQWRKPWPKNRKGQQRLLGNGTEIVEKLNSILPKNVLIRLVDTASLPIVQQISIMQNTDYFLGIHGAGLFLSIFLPKHAILHEIKYTIIMNNLQILGVISGHKVYSDIIEAYIDRSNYQETIFFNLDQLSDKVLIHMRENNF